LKAQLNPFLITGMFIVVFALMSYSAAIFFEVKTRLASRAVLGFFTAGVIFDITSTTFMILGSRHIPITPHGLLGYSALAVMLIDAVLLWRHRMTKGAGVKIPRGLHIYSITAYSWWVLAFIAGGLLVMIK
jgi:EamA domain-containing membrane protein RarD